MPMQTEGSQGIVLDECIADDCNRTIMKTSFADIEVMNVGCRTNQQIG